MKEQPYEPDSTSALDILGNSPFFGRLDRAARAEIADGLQMVTLTTGEALFRAGDPGDSLYIVDRGLLEVRMTDESGAVRVLDRLDADQPWARWPC